MDQIRLIMLLCGIDTNDGSMKKTACDPPGTNGIIDNSTYLNNNPTGTTNATTSVNTGKNYKVTIKYRNSLVRFIIVETL